MLRGHLFACISPETAAPAKSGLPFAGTSATTFEKPRFAKRTSGDTAAHF